MKATPLPLFLLLPFFLFAQGGWTKITDGPIATFTSEGTFKGSAWVDINNDGNIDLFAMPNFIFLNNGNGSFTQLTGLNINPTPLQLPGGCSWGDINNDGFIDFITAQNPSEIYLNNGDNTFQNITSTLPGLSGYASWGAALGDINNDNKLDLIYAQALGFHGTATSYPCRLFTQNADMSFIQVSGYNFTDTPTTYTVPYFDDYDMDGDMDLFIASGPGGNPGPDYCYKNMKTETGNDLLVQMTTEPWAATMQDGQCYNFIDYDNDGDLDCCLTNYAGAPSRFYKNNNGSFQITGASFSGTGAKLSNDWGDYDNDGDLDVIIARNVSSLVYYRNNGNGTFTSQSQSITAPTGSNNIVNGDFDNDGDLDVFVNGLDDARSLWRNDDVAQGRKFVNYTLKGVVSNTSAIGAFVKLKATINGNPVWQVRHVNAQNSFQGQNDLRVHFGLNDATVIDSLLIYWPSGLREYYLNKPVNQFETLVEGAGTMLAIKENVKPESIRVFPNPAKDYVTVLIDDKFFSKFNLKITDASGRIVYSDILLNPETKVPVKQLQDGTYVFIIEHDGKYITKKSLFRIDPLFEIPIIAL